MQASQPQSDLVGEVVNVFSLIIDHNRPLSTLVQDNNFDYVHFFLREALAEGVIPEESSEPITTRNYALVPYTNENGELNEEIFTTLKSRNLEPASLRELLHFALQYPLAQRAEDVLALETMRMRRTFSTKPGITEWGSFPLDKTMCQWITALTFTPEGRALIPIELFLPDVLRRTTALLVRQVQFC